MYKGQVEARLSAIIDVMSRSGYAAAVSAAVAARVVGMGLRRNSRNRYRLTAPALGFRVLGF